MSAWLATRSFGSHVLRGGRQRRPHLVLLAVSAFALVLAGCRLPSPNAPGATSSTLAAVACASDSFCVAVGQAASPTLAGATLIETWNGSTWSVTPSPSPAGAVKTSLDGIACPTAELCFAVGSYTPFGSSDHFALMEAWNGTAWSIVDASTSVSSLADVTCSSTTSCFAVGGQGVIQLETTLVEHWDGVAWSPVASPAFPPGTFAAALVGVACPSSSSCVAAGTALSNALPCCLPESAFVETWDGTSWVLDNRAAVPNVQPASVSCSTSTSCMVAGRTAVPNDTTYQPFAEQLNDSGWSVLSVPIPGGAAHSLFGGAVCTTATSCYGVGTYDSPSGPAALVDRWDGASWTQVTADDPAGSSLAGITCLTLCTSVGTYTTQESSGTIYNTLVDIRGRP